MNQPDTSQDRPALGIALMVGAMGLFATSDALIKLMAPAVSPAQVMFLLTGGGLVIFAAIALLKGERASLMAAFAPVLLVRYVAEIIGMVGMVTALMLVPLATVGAMLQATPLLTLVGAVVWLGERVSWRRWTAVVVGLFGVLLIVQPGAEGFDINVLWAVVAMVGLSIRDLVTRLTPPALGSATLATFTMLASVPFAAIWTMGRGEALFPAGADYPLVVVMATLGAVGYLMLISSLRWAPVSTVSPFRYTRLLFLLAIAALFFGERPGAVVMLGATLVIVSGIYMMWREKVVASASKDVKPA